MEEPGFEVFQTAEYVRVPSLMFIPGTKNLDCNITNPAHNPRFELDEDILPIGVTLFSEYCLNRL